MSHENKDEYRYTADINGYKQAVWDFLLEHSELLDSGALFIKFHISDRKNFENRVIGRWKHNYHREDPRAKEEEHISKRSAFEEKKSRKKKDWEEHKAHKKEIKKALQELETLNSIPRFARPFYKLKVKIINAIYGKK